MADQPPHLATEAHIALRQMLQASSVRRRVLELLLHDLADKQIAALLGRSPHTVRGHLTDMYRAVGGGRVRLALVGQAVIAEMRRSRKPRAYDREALKTNGSALVPPPGIEG